MRVKFIAALLLATLLVLGAGWFLKRRLAPAPVPPAMTFAPVPTVVSTSIVPATPAPQPAPVAVAPTPVPPPTAEEHQAAVDAEVDRLQQWSMNDDPQSLSNILADLYNPEKEIRAAAVEATKQFGSSNAIPVLKAAANNIEDAQEKIVYLEAADFLSLPSISSGQNLPPRSLEQMQAAQVKINQHHTRAGAPDKTQNSNPNPPPDQNPPQDPPAQGQ